MNKQDKELVGEARATYLGPINGAEYMRRLSEKREKREKFILSAQQDLREFLEDMLNE